MHMGYKNILHVPIIAIYPGQLDPSGGTLVFIIILIFMQIL